MKNAESAAPLFQLRIKADLLRRIRDRAKKERRSVSEFMRHAAELELRRKKAA
jgi:Ribbon-helix-helix protein, copG family